MNGIEELIRIRIPLRLGGELHIKNTGELNLGNPQSKPAENMHGADAILLYHFDRRTGEHILRLVDTVVDDKHIRGNYKDDASVERTATTAE